MDDLLQRNRYELKYIISESCARDVRDFARHYLAPDPFGDPAHYGGQPAYAIHSVYLDSPKLDLMHATVEGHKNRFKLRMRFYDGRPDSPVFFEIKRRVNGAILKDRARVRREFGPALLEGAWPEPQHLSKPGDAKGFAALRKFCELRDKLAAKPGVLVSYEREAWLTPDNNSARLTFDRRLQGSPYDRSLSLCRNQHWVTPRVEGVVLELKFTDRFPHWMRDAVRLFNLERCSMAKYVHCVQSLEPRCQAEARDERWAALPRTILAHKNGSDYSRMVRV